MLAGENAVVLPQQMTATCWSATTGSGRSVPVPVLALQRHDFTGYASCGHVARLADSHIVGMKDRARHRLYRDCVARTPVASTWAGRRPHFFFALSRIHGGVLALASLFPDDCVRIRSWCGSVGCRSPICSTADADRTVPSAARTAWPMTALNRWLSCGHPGRRYDHVPQVLDLIRPASRVGLPLPPLTFRTLRRHPEAFATHVFLRPRTQVSWAWPTFCPRVMRPGLLLSPWTRPSSDARRRPSSLGRLFKATRSLRSDSGTGTSPLSRRRNTVSD